MSLPDSHLILNAVVVLAGVAIAWTLLRGVLRFAARFLSVGCLAVVALVAVAWFARWLH